MTKLSPYFFIIQKPCRKGKSFYRFPSEKSLTSRLSSVIISIVSFTDAVQSADVAQLAEQLICNQQVTGSSPIVGSTRFIAGISVKIE